MNRKIVGSIVVFLGILTIAGKFFFRNIEYSEALSWGGLALTILGALLISEKKT